MGVAEKDEEPDEEIGDDVDQKSVKLAFYLFAHQDDTTSEYSDATNNTASESVDSRGIPAWDKVAKLAQFLTSQEGMSSSNEKAHMIKTLWNALDPYGNKATEVILKTQVRLRGHFCSQKKTCHTTVQQMRRYFVCNNFVFNRCFQQDHCLPLNCIVAVICIILTNNQLQSVKNSGAGIVLILYLC